MYRGLIGLGLCLPMVAWASEPAKNQWPGFRGHGNSQVVVSVPVTWELRGRRGGNWTIRLPGYGQSSPVVWGDRVFVTAVSGTEKEHLHVLGLQLADGKTAWQQDFAGTQRVTDGDAVSRGAPTPVVDADRLYVVFESGDVIALDHDGTVLWQRSIVKEYGEFKGPHGYASSPVLAGEMLILQVCHGGPSYLLALDRVTGENRWKVDHPAQTGWSSPAVYEHDGVHGLVVSTSGSVRAFAVEDGRPLWWVTGMTGNSTPSPTIVGDVIVIGGSSERMGPPAAEGVTPGSLAIRLGGQGDVTATHVLWKSSKVSAGYASPLVVDDAAYFVGRLGTLQCVDIHTGTVRWQHRLPGTTWASPLHAAGKLFFFCKDGSVVVLEAGAALKEVGENSISATDIIYGVAAVDNAWLVRTGRGLIKIATE